MGKSVFCYGDYKDMGECGECPLVHACVDATIENDHYYDSLANDIQTFAEEREEALIWDSLSLDT